MTSRSSCTFVKDVFSEARNKPAKSFCLLYSSRTPLFLITTSCGRSIRSYVVKRWPHSTHIRRRRIASPSATSRDSITFVSSCWHSLHFMLHLYYLYTCFVQFECTSALISLDI